MTIGKIRAKLRTLSGDDFANQVEVLMGVLSPRVALSKRLGKLDRQGIDIFVFDDQTMDIEIAIQCKGYERPYGSDLTPGLLAEIAKFGQRGPLVDQYWLVVNQAITETQDCAAIEAELDKLRHAGRCRAAKLLDVNQLEKLLSIEAENRIREWVDRYRERMVREYRERMAFTRYLPNVPYERDGAANGNPSRLMLDEIRDFLEKADPSSTGPNRFAPRFLLTASFGFGKTSALHEVASEWLSGGGTALYLPAALLPSDVFHSTVVALETLLPMIVPEDEELPDSLGLHIMRKAWKKLFRTTKDFLVLVDAIDESDLWYDQRRLSALWTVISQLGAPAVVSVREEVYHSRPLEFTYPSGHRKGRPFFERLSLLEWSGVEIAAFLEAFAQERGAAPSTGFAKLRDIVAAGDYERVFGDIPRRPLFLGMLAEDAWQREEPERRLDRLYERYMRAKATMDRYSASANGRAVRAGAVFERLGDDEGVEALLRAMTRIALDLLNSGSSADGASREFDEATLRAHLVAELGEIDKIEEITLNSLIMPAGRRDPEGRRLYRFAHKSFQDWFAARGLLRSSAHIERDPTQSVRYFLDLMRSDA